MPTGPIVKEKLGIKIIKIVAHTRLVYWHMQQHGTGKASPNPTRLGLINSHLLRNHK